MSRSLVIPRFIKAKDERALERALLSLQARKQARMYIITIYPVKDGVVAWYTDSGADLVAGAGLEIVKNLGK